jgi:lysophospholipase L1-like esterase/Flp pilus assembly protein TadD
MNTNPGEALRRRPRRHRRLLFLAWIAFSSTLLLELVLQIGSVVVWWQQRRPAAPLAQGTETILCVGDSWTHGMGSSDPALHAYPAVLQELLRAQTGRPLVVVNGGQSGQNSRDVLVRLPSQLAEFRPRIVGVLVGQNDFWSFPDELASGAGSEASDHGAYRFRWRVPRLLAWLHGKLRGTGLADPAPSNARGPGWAPRPAPSPLPHADEPRRWAETGMSRASKQRGWSLEAAHDIPGAIEAFERAHGAAPDDPQARQMLVSLYRRAGRPSAATPHLEWLAAQWSRDAEYWSGRSLVAALEAVGRNAEAITVAEKFLRRFPQDAQVWRYLGQCQFFVGRHDDALRSIDESIRLAPERWNHYWRHKIHFHGKRDVDEAIRDIYRAYVAMNDSPAALADLSALVASSDASRLRPVLAAFACDAEVRSRLEQLVVEITETRSAASAERVLRAHLARVARTIRAAGAVPVFLTYPLPQRSDRVLEEAAEALGVRLLRVGVQVVARHGGRPLAELRAADGHCNDAGYRLAAEIVAEGLSELLRQ